MQFLTTERILSRAVSSLLLLIFVPLSIAEGPSTRPPKRTSENARANSVQPSENVRSDIEAFTEPYSDISIAASEMGTVSRVMVKEGELVSSGTVVAGLDDQVLHAALDVARSSMEASGMLRSAKADLQMKKTELEKLEELRGRSHASQKEVDRVQAELLVAEARVQSVQEDLGIKRLEYKRIEAQIAQRLLKSPIDGVVTEVLKETGEFVSPSDPVVVRVVRLDPLLVVFSVPLEQRKQVRPEQKVQLQIGAESTAAEGIVEYVSPTADSSNTSVRVKVRLPNPDSRWQAGERVVLITVPPTAVPENMVTSPLAKRDN